MSELAINGKSIGAVEIAHLKPGVTLDQAKAKFQKDGYDQVVFKQDDQLLVAYGRNLDIPAKWNGTAFSQPIPSSDKVIQEFEKDGKSYVTVREYDKPVDREIPTATLDGKKIRIEWTNDEATSAKEGAVRRLKTGAILIGSGASVGMMTGIMAKFFERVMRGDPLNMGAAIGVGAAFGAGVGGIAVVHGAVKGHRNQPNDAAIKELTQ